MNISDKLIIPILILTIILVSVLEKRKTFDIFTEGVIEGLETLVKLFPVLLGLFLSVNMLRASGIINFLTDVFGKVFEILLIPKELISIIFLKPISASSSLAIATDLFKQYGVDSMIGLIVSTILGSTETTFYTIAVYTGAIKKKISKKLIILSILGNFLGIFLSVIICKIIF